MAANRPGKPTVVVLLALVILTPVLIISALVVGATPATAPPAPNEGEVLTLSGQSSTSLSVSTTTAAATTISSACQNATSYSGIDSVSPMLYNSSAQSFPILSMRPGQTALLCIEWTSTLTVSNPINLTGSLSIGNYSTKTFPNGTLKTLFTPSPDFVVKPAQTPIFLGDGGGPSLVVGYTINATAGSKGFYFLNVQGLFPTGCDDEFRFAVGYSFTDANKSGDYFPLPAAMGSCADAGGILGPPMPPPGGIYSQLYATSGIKITSLDCSKILCDLRQPA